MSIVNLDLNEKRHGRFTVTGEAGQSGEMVVAVSDNGLVVYHTEVTEQAEGKGFARKMFDAMVAYARENNFQVKPLCTYVQAQFKRRPDEYKDIWTAGQTG